MPITQSGDIRVRKKLFQLRLRQVNAAHRAGVKLLAGTDATSTFHVHGFSLHDELALFVQAGLTPMEALHTLGLFHLQEELSPPAGIKERFGKGAEVFRMQRSDLRYGRLLRAPTLSSKEEMGDPGTAIEEWIHIPDRGKQSIR